jgi:hypothetical protein
MQRPLFTRTASALLFLTGVAAPAFANNLVVNGSFEMPATTSFTDSGPASQNGNGAVDQWGITGSDGGVFFDPGGVPAGSQGGFIDAVSTFYQDVGPLSPNTLYVLNLSAGQTNDQPATVGNLTESLATGSGSRDDVLNTAGFTPLQSGTSTPGASFGPTSPLIYTTGPSVSGDLFVLLTLTGGTFDRRSAQV